MENKRKIWYGGFAFIKAFIFKHPVNQLTKKYFKHLKTKNFTNEGWIDRPLVPSSDVTNYPKTG